MEGPRLLSGCELVAKGATRKVDGQLPQSGLKEVFPDGLWLEQKQIQSALEARKHLIAIERIEKSGSLSHAEWRDDLKLAEVTKQVGGHWQYIGHKKGKCLYLLPEETLFLMEVNSLLLKHNDVTVSLQKAYSLCLTDISLMQYKVYASLSRLGYRVFRHKKPKPDAGIISVETIQDSKEKADDTLVEVCANVSTDSIKTTEKSLTEDDKNEGNGSIVIRETNNKVSQESNEQQETTVVYANDVTAKKVAVNDKMEIDESCDGRETSNSDTGSALPNDIPQNSTSVQNDDNSNNSDKPISSNNKNNMCLVLYKKINETEETFIESKENKGLPLAVNNKLMSSSVATASEMDIDDRNADIKQKAVEIAPVCSKTLKAENSVIIYSVDECGVIRPQKIDMEINSTSNDEASIRKLPESAIADSTNDAARIKDVSTNESLKHYQAELKHFDNKIKKLSDRCGDLTSDKQALDTLQNFYKERIVNVNIPEEKYLPRNIFLHKTGYRLNMDIISNQNASNVSSDEMDSLESPTRTPSATNAHNQSILTQYGNYNSNTQTRYPTHQHQRQTCPRQNYNFMYRPSIQNFFVHPRWRVPHPLVRQQYMFNNNMPGFNQQANNRHDSMKTYHYNMIFYIVSRFKTSGVASVSQLRSLQNLLNTFNLRYNANLSMTQDFTIVDAKNQPPPAQSTTRAVIVLDDEPERKKRRISDDSDKINSNLKKLKELAAKLKDLHAKNLAMSRHRRVFSNAIKTFNRAFKADFYLDDNFEMMDRKLVVVDSSSDSDAVVVKETDRPKKRKKLRNPYSILKNVVKNDKASTSINQHMPVLQTLSLNIINVSNVQNNTGNDQSNIASTDVNDNAEGLSKYFKKEWLPSDEDFGRAELCSRQKARLDALLFQAEYLHDVLNESVTEFENWKEIKLYYLREMRTSLDVQKQQAEALSNDFFMETESQIQPILRKDCTDLRSALKELAIISTCKDLPAETNLKVDFDVCNRDVPFKKSNPPKPNFRVVCYCESAAFPSGGDVSALQANYNDGVPTVFAFVGSNASISYLQINCINLPVFIPEQFA